MAIQKVTGNTVLDTVISKLNKDFGKSLISLGPTVEKMSALPTGSLALDFAIGIGGLPRGRCIEILGLEASGKTSWCLFWASQFQLIDKERFVLIVDAEHTMNIELLTGYGIDMKRVIFLKPTKAPEALDSILALVKSGQVGFVMLDSIDALQTEAQLNKGTGENEMGGISKPLNRFFREYSKVADENDCTSIFINQIKFNPGASYGANPETSSGGTGIRFYTSLRMKFMPAKPSETTKGAFKSRIKIIKNRAAAPVDRFIECDFIYARGPDPLMDTLNAAKDLGVLHFAGPTLKLNTPSGVETLSTGGIAGFIELCRNDPSVLPRIREACMATRNIVTIPASDEDSPPPDDE